MNKLGFAPFNVCSVMQLCNAVLRLHVLPIYLSCMHTDELGGATMKSLVEAAAAGAKPRLYLVDYWDLTVFFTTEWKDSDKVLHAGRALLYLQQ